MIRSITADRRARMASLRPRFRWFRTVGGACLLIILLAVASSCRREQGTDPRSSRPQSPEGLSRELTAVTQTIGQCVLDAYRSCDAQTRELEVRVGEWAQFGSAEHRTSAKDKWISVMAQWQQAELIQFGPAAPKSEPGGRELGDQVYAWPLSGRCLIDQNIVAKAYASADFESALTVVRDVGALEYLLFHEGQDNGCPASSAINADRTWESVGETQRQHRKTEYAIVVAGLIAKTMRELRAAWEPHEGNFFQSFVAPGQGPSPYSSQLAVLSAMSNALFYLDKELKDDKLGRPLGLLRCDKPSCPEAVESRYAHVSLLNIRQNLLGAKNLLSGCKSDTPQSGLLSYVRAKGAETLAQRMSVALDEAIRVADEMPSSDIESLLESDRPSVLRLHAALKSVTDILKTEFVTAINVQVPAPTQGDTD